VLNSFRVDILSCSITTSFLPWCNKLYPAMHLTVSFLLSLVFLHPFASITRFHSRIKVMGWLKCYTLSIEIVSRLNMVSKRCSEFPKTCKNILIFEIIPFSSLYEILHHKCVRVFTIAKRSFKNLIKLTKNGYFWLWGRRDSSVV
jgi:hypothetical protein